MPLATSLDKETIREVYEDVRSDLTDTEWLGYSRRVFCYQFNCKFLLGEYLNLMDRELSVQHEVEISIYLKINSMIMNEPLVLSGKFRYCL